MHLLKKLTTFAIAFSLAWPVSAAGTPLLPNLPARVVKIGTKRYVVSERTTKKGRLLSTLVAGDDFRELKIDEFGTGTASRWELRKGFTTLRASVPYRGHFTKIEIEQRRPTNRIFFNLTYISRLNRYRLDTYHTQSYRMLGADNVIFGDTCSLTNTQDLDHFRKLVDALNGAGSSQANLTCKLKIESSLMFDASCDTPTMAASQDDRLKALADILESGPVKSTDAGIQTKSGYVSSAGGTYLSCLEEHGLAKHSADIQAKLYNEISNAQSSIDLAHFSGAISDDQYKELQNASAPNCKVSAATLQAVAKAGNPANYGAPLFTCALPKGTAVKDADDYRGNYISSDGVEQIVLGLPKEAMPAAMGSHGFTAESAYASTMLHEFVHSTGIGDENLTLNAEACCAGVDAGSKTTACKALDDRLVIYEKENRFNGVMNQSVFDSDQVRVSEYLNRKLNSSTDSDDFVHRYQQTMGQKIESQSAVYAAIKDKDGKKVCSQESPQSDYCISTQRDFAESHLIQYTKDFLANDCPGILRAQNHTVDDAQKFCANSKLKSILTDSVTYDLTSKPVGPAVTVAVMPGDSIAPAHASAVAAAKINPYADLFTPQTGLQGSVNVGGTTVAGAVISTNSSPISMAGARTRAQTQSIDGVPSGAATDITTGAVSGQAGVGSNTRVDALDGINQSEALAAGINSTATALGGAVHSVASTIVPTANAATGVSDSASPDPQQDIIVTARRAPTKSQSAHVSDDQDVHQNSNLASAFTQALSNGGAAHASADSSSGASISTYSGTTISGPFSVKAAAAPSTDSSSVNMKPTVIARAAVDPQPATNRASASLAPAPVANLSGGAAGSSAGFAAASGGGGFDRGPSSTQPQTAPPREVNAANSGGVPTFQTQQQLDRWLTLDYARIEEHLTKTATSVQLIRLRTEVISPQQPKGIGCVPRRGCQPARDKIYTYCPLQNRLLPSTKACR